jgi:hypothetical protein
MRPRTAVQRRLGISPLSTRVSSQMPISAARSMIAYKSIHTAKLALCRFTFAALLRRCLLLAVTSCATRPSIPAARASMSGSSVVVGGDAEDELVGVAEHRDAGAQLKGDRRDRQDFQHPPTPSVSAVLRLGCDQGPRHNSMSVLDLHHWSRTPPGRGRPTTGVPRLRQPTATADCCAATAHDTPGSPCRG